MASPFGPPSGTTGPYQRAEYFTGHGRRSSEIMPSQSQSQDVAVPAHLLRATGNLGSKRDNSYTTHHRTWDPEAENPFLDSNGVGSIRRRGTQDSGVQRNGTQRSTNLERTQTQGEKRRSNRFSWLSATGGNKRTSQHSAALPSPTEENIRPYRTLSYTPGTDEVIAVTPRESRAPSPVSIEKTTTKSTKWSSNNPFASKSNSVKSNPFATPGHSARVSIDEAPQEPEAVHHAQRGRKGTLQSVADAIVPDSLQRKMTNASYFKRSEMFGTYEKAKQKGVDIQRKKWVQVTFEYTIYLIMVLFIYFVLIGIPLWNGAVWWLYWVVATKFVIAGGFGITLGIALL